MLWSVAVVVGTISTAIGFAVLSKASPFVISIAISFAAGAILVMLAESMIPEAFEEGGSKIGACYYGRFYYCVCIRKVRWRIEMITGGCVNTLFRRRYNR